MIRIRTTLVLAAATLLMHVEAIGQPRPGFLNTWTNSGSGDWTNASNWDGANIPDGQGTLGFGDDFAVIDNGGEAIVSSSVTQPGAIPGGIGVGSLNGTFGSLTIQNGGTLEVLGFDGADADGSVQIGRETSGSGVLSISGNGRLLAESIATGGASETAVNLSDTASVSLTGLANFGRITRIDGPNVDFSTTGDLLLRGSGTVVAGISGATHSPLKATGTATVGGSLFVEFDSVPTAGESWQVIDAGAISGGFASIDSNVELGAGQLLSQRLTTSGATNGNALEVFVVQRLLLTVDRDTGNVAIENLGAPLALDAYSVSSASGALNQANWTPLGGAWEAANPDTTNLSELVQSGTATLASGALSLGNVYSPPAPTAFGEAVEDLVLTYAGPALPGPGGAGIEGIVQYSGTSGINNLTLVVDPASGKAQIMNTSIFDVDIDAYTIASESSSLDPNDWTSLSAGDGEWDVANMEVDRVSELRPTDATLLASGDKLDLGMLFNEISGTQDLTFQFLLGSEDAARVGDVVYQTISDVVVLFGDADNDLAVAGSDLLAVTNNFGSTGPADGLLLGDADDDGAVAGSDLLAVTNNFGSTLGSSALGAGEPVPEPATGLVLLYAATLLYSAGRLVHR